MVLVGFFFSLCYFVSGTLFVCCIKKQCSNKGRLNKKEIKEGAGSRKGGCPKNTKFLFIFKETMTKTRNWIESTKSVYNKCIFHRNPCHPSSLLGTASGPHIPGCLHHSNTHTWLALLVTTGPLRYCYKRVYLLSVKLRTDISSTSVSEKISYFFPSPLTISYNKRSVHKWLSLVSLL